MFSLINNENIILRLNPKVSKVKDIPSPTFVSNRALY